jgi:L-fucose mutarotase
MSDSARVSASASLARLDFYAECRQPDLAVCVATGDNRLYANLLLTIGFVAPA